jgi:1-hydroxycarotenoid 3,4-desaturase
MRSSVVVVGAGFGGLSAALMLRAAGLDVTVVERATVAGGKARSVDVGGLPIDVGPTVLTMRWVFDELCAALGRSLEDVVGISTADTVARHVFADGTTLDLHADLERSVDAVARLAGATEARAYERFAVHCAKIADTVREPFLRSERPSMKSLMKTGLGLAALTRIDAHRSMWRAIRSFFSDERLVALFARYATYVGSSPFETPATLNLIAHVEREGVALVDGGISALARALAQLAMEMGVVFRHGAIVRHVAVESGRVSGVVIEQDGARELVSADAVVANVDVATIAWGALGPAAAAAVQRPEPRKRSLSALTWAIAGSASGLELDRHNVFFPRDYAAEHTALFDERRVPSEPTVYVCAQDRGATRRPIDGDGKERFFVIVNAPAVADEAPLESEEQKRCERAMFERLSKAGLSLNPEAVAIATPASFEQLAPGTGGAIYGTACHGAFAPLSRPSSRTKLPGFHLAGGTVHPGPGVPMAALSGRLAAESVIADLASTRRSRSWATVGSISTP